MPQPFPALPPDRRGTLHHHQVPGPHLAGNPWGDPSTREVIVYTPVGHAADDTLPTVLLLAGFAGTGEGMLARGLGDVPIQTRIDRLVDGGCPPFRVVLPDVMTSLGGSQFVDSPGIGAYRSWLLHDVMPWIAERHPVAGRWGVAGRSSGGFGAFGLAAAAPDRIGAVGIHAGDAGFDLCYLGDLPAAIRGVRKAGGLDGFLDHFWAQERPSGDLFAALNVIAMSCAYAPDPKRSPFPARLPFDPETGAIDFEVYQSWRVHDPVVRAADPEVQAALRAMALVFVDAGAQDEYGLQLGARRLVDALRAGGVDVEHQEFTGGHRGTAWRYDVSLPAIVRALVADAT
ncbi:MAG: hypothetical protein H6733_05550 [Alphaproteobacteria bacterium]|nr:hypothetical protein [Alphaproteobacteria bacterium]